jgi:hypothetical protein
MAAPYDYAFCQLKNNSKNIRILIIEKNETDILEARLQQLEKESKESYNALSWCWRTYGGDDNHDEQLTAINIIHHQKKYSLQVSHNLNAALKTLRKRNILRIWIDWVCINQKDVVERSNQVQVSAFFISITPPVDLLLQLMATIYGGALCVYIWIGDSKDGSDVAFKFIPEILKVEHFDKLIENEENHHKWKAVKMLMMRDWFSRRWIIQEVALANSATLLCGNDELDWSKFADAVSLFTEFETETRGLSDIMKTRREYGHVPDYFGDLAALSAAHLVEITNRLFRLRSNGHREPLLSLEYLVSTFITFNSSEARDTIYAILAIAKDTTPQTTEQIDTVLVDPDRLSNKSETLVKMLRHFVTLYFESFTESQPYIVDYRRPISDVYVEFVKFCIERSKQSDPTRALDILCRPWAPDPDFHDQDEKSIHWRAKFTAKMGYDGKFEEDDHGRKLQSQRGPDGEIDTIPSWIPSKETFSHGWTTQGGGRDDLKMARMNPDSLVGIPSQRLYSASGGKGVTDSLRFQDGKIVEPDNNDYDNTHYHSIFVEGFVLGTIEQLSHPSLKGVIPRYWATLVRNISRSAPTNRRDSRQERRDLWDHPGAEDFWRTLVGDQSWTGRDPPRYYKLILKNEYSGKMDVNLETPINYHKCQPAIAVCRRVQAVIWGRKLMSVLYQLRKGRAEAPEFAPDEERRVKVLGLAPEQAEKDDLVCILYGCSVPVVLRKHDKSESVFKSEKEQQQNRREDEARKKIESFILNTCYRVRLEKAIRWLKDEEARKRQSAARSRGHQSSTPAKRQKKRATIDVDPDDGTMAPPPKRTKRRTPRRSTLSPELGRTFGRQSTTESFEVDSRQTTPKRIGSMPASNHVDQPPESNDKVFYQMIGECYVHGMMNGEAIDHQNVEELQRTIFEIR